MVRALGVCLFLVGFLVGLSTGALAQITETPGPGGIPLAPGVGPVQGYTPGGIGLGGSRVAPGPAAAGMPFYRRGPGGVPVLVAPQGNAAAPGASIGTGTSGTGGASANHAPCTTRSCLPAGLSLTVDSRDSVPVEARDSTIDTMQDLHLALRACWTPPAETRELQMSVRFSFRRSGELIGAPFVTYTSRGASAQARQDYRGAITSAISGCAPFRLSRSFAAAIAGQPISVRFVDHRSVGSDAR
jgi:hypothetical protein